MMATATGSGSAAGAGGPRAARQRQQEERDAAVLSDMMAFLADLKMRSTAPKQEPSAKIEEEHAGVQCGGDGAGVAPAVYSDEAAAAAALGVAPRVAWGRLEYTNGDVYEGDLLGGRLRHGRGTHACAAGGGSYAGDWRLDQRHGRGEFVAPDGMRYKGAFKHDRAQGHGTCWYPDGSKYEGDFEEDARAGWGRLETPQGDSYEGEWAGDKMHGQGKFTYANGDYYLGSYAAGQRIEGKLVLGKGEYEYSGSFKDGEPHGQGVAVAKGLYLYRGPFERGARHGGGGECRYADGSKYTGAWRRDARCGRGRLEGADGTVYDGEWLEDKRHGQGTCRHPSGERYAGQWQAGERAGEGRAVFANGDKYAGSWAGDAMDGLGVMAYANGDRYQGEWRAGKRHGTGLMIFADGARFKGRWQEGAWVQSAADPARCRLRGRGLARAVAGEAASFIIQARDEDNNPRLSGGDIFTVTLLRPAAREAAAAAAAGPAASGGQALLTAVPSGAAAGQGSAAEAAAEGGEQEGQATREEEQLQVVARGAVRDLADGTYEVAYTLTGAGRHLLAVTDGDGNHVADSPYPLLVLPGAPAPRRCAAAGAGRRAAPAGGRGAFSVQAHDAFGNVCDSLSAAELAGMLALRAVLRGGSGGEVAAEVECVPAAEGGGRWECSYAAPAAPGLYVLDVLAAPANAVCGGGGQAANAGGAGMPAAASGWVHIRGSPFSVRIAPAGEGSGGAAWAAAAGTATASDPAGEVVVDRVAAWKEVARQEYEKVAGSLEGFEDDATAGGKEAAAEVAYAQANPNVAVVERLEDLWLLGKLQRERGARAAASGAPARAGAGQGALGEAATVRASSPRDEARAAAPGATPSEMAQDGAEACCKIDLMALD